MERIQQLLKEPNKIVNSDIEILQTEIIKYPYFQPIKIIYLSAIQKYKPEVFQTELEKNAIYFPYKSFLFETFHKPIEPIIFNTSGHETLKDTMGNENNIEIVKNKDEIEINEIENTVSEKIPNIISKKINKLEEDNLTNILNPNPSKDKYYLSLKKLGLEHLYPKENIEDSEKDIEFQDPLVKEILVTENLEVKVEMTQLDESINQDVENILIEETPHSDKNTIKLKNVPPNIKLTFQQWLQLSNIQPYIKDDEKYITKDKKTEIIENFIVKNPKIKPTKHKEDTEVIESKLVVNKEEISHLMTETLANLYIEQNKWMLAVKAFKILSLKYPEKSSYFANRIEEIERKN